MKYLILFFTILVSFACVEINASQRDVPQPGAFDPEIGARLFIKNRFNPMARFSVFAPRGNKTKELLNRYTNYLIPSKQEIIANIGLSIVHNKEIVSKLLAYISCALLETYKQYPQSLNEAHDAYVNQKRASGTQLLPADLRSENAPNNIKIKAAESALMTAGKQVAYESGKLYAIGYIRSKLDPYVQQVVQKSTFLQSINNSNSSDAAAVRYVGNRIIHGTLDIGCNATYDFLKKTMLNFT